jgi:hypothetical protein
MKSCQPFGHEILPTLMSQTLRFHPLAVKGEIGDQLL